MNGAAQETITQGFGITTQSRSNEMAAVAVAAAAKSEIESAYIVAMKQPRNEDDARVKILKICASPMFAAKARYAKPVGQTRIEGPSIRFAEEMLRHWGNVLVQQTAIYDDDEKRIVKVTVRDLESNLSYSKELTIEKHVERRDKTGREVLRERPNTTGQRVYVVRATEDELQNKESALVSKVMRNNGLRLIPQHIIDEAMGIATETIRLKVADDPEGEKKVMLDSFADLGVLPSAIEEYCSCTIAQLAPRQIVELRAIHTAIKDGQATWTDYARMKETVTEHANKPLKEKLKAQVAQTETQQEDGAGPEHPRPGDTQPPSPGPAQNGFKEIPAEEWESIIHEVDAVLALVEIKKRWKAAHNVSNVMKLKAKGQESFLVFIREEAEKQNLTLTF
jgi:hypothetical protein